MTWSMTFLSKCVVQRSPGGRFASTVDGDSAEAKRGFGHRHEDSTSPGRNAASAALPRTALKSPMSTVGSPAGRAGPPTVIGVEVVIHSVSFAISSARITSSGVLGCPSVSNPYLRWTPMTVKGGPPPIGLRRAATGSRLPIGAGGWLPAERSRLLILASIVLALKPENKAVEQP